MLNTPHGSVLLAVMLLAVVIANYEDLSHYDLFWFWIATLNAGLQVREWLKLRRSPRH